MRSDWNNTAHLYDYDDRDVHTDKASFFSSYLCRTAGNILEVACGTGKITIPLAFELREKEREIVAFDFSNKMLDVFRGKLSETTLSNIKVCHANMIDFSFAGKFGLIIDTGFAHLTKDGDIEKYLNNIKNHLADDGLYIVVLFLPDGDYGASWVGKESKSFEVTDEKARKKIARHTKNLSSDTENQIFTYQSLYYVTDLNTGQVDCYSDAIMIRYYYRKQMEYLLNKMGFTIFEYHTSYTKKEIEKDKRQIFVVGKGN